MSVSGKPWPQHIGLLLDYLHERRLEPCARTMPVAFLAALSFVERVGGVQPCNRFSESLLLRNTVNQLTTDLERKAMPKRQAPMLPLSIIGATELAVSDASLPLYIRGFAFYKLLKLWTASRTNDLFGLNPGSLRLTEHGLCGTLDRTKTSGPGKRVRFLPVFVSSRVFIMNPNWLGDGWAIWSQNEDMNFQRDYFLPLPTEDYQSARRVLADYARTVSLSKYFWSNLRAPVWRLDAWHLSESHLFSVSDTLAFWTEHSERNWLVSVLASLGVPRERREFIGRWRAISASDEYLRTAKAMVISLQEQALAGVLQDERWNLRNGGLDDLLEFLISRGINPGDADAQKQLLELPHWRWVSQPRDLAVSASPETVLPVPAQEDSDAPYFISIVGKKRLRRLHRRGGCGTDPSDLREVDLLFSLDGAIFDFACRHCWRKGDGPAAIGPASVQVRSSESDSSSSSSSSSSAG